MEERKINKFLFRLMGAMFCIIGLSIIIEPKSYMAKVGFYIDFTGFNIPVGVGLIVLGMFIFGTTMIQPSKNKLNP